MRLTGKNQISKNLAPAARWSAKDTRCLVLGTSLRVAELRSTRKVVAPGYEGNRDSRFGNAIVGLYSSACNCWLLMCHSERSRGTCSLCARRGPAHAFNGSEGRKERVRTAENLCSPRVASNRRTRTLRRDPGPDAFSQVQTKSVGELCRRYATRDSSATPTQHSAFGCVLGYHVGRPQGAQILGCSTDIGKVQFSQTPIGAQVPGCSADTSQAKYSHNLGRAHQTSNSYLGSASTATSNLE